VDIKSGYPFSLIRNGLVFDYPKLETGLHAPVVILGGGISGALTAFHLVQKNIPCVVLDARSIGLGSTCASTSLLQYEIDVPLHRLARMIGAKNACTAYWLCRDAIDKLFVVAETTGFKDIERKKSLYYAAFRKDVPGLEEEFRIRKLQEFDITYFNESALFTSTGIRAPAAILSADGAQTDAYAFTHAIHQYNLQKGARVFDRTPVRHIQHKTRSVELTTAEGHKIIARKLVYANGYEVVNYIDKPIVKLHSTYATVSEPLSRAKPYWKDDMLIWNTAHPYLYMRTVAGNRILVGGRDEDFFSPRKRDLLIRAKAKKLTADFRKLFPDISFIPEFSWTGTFGSTRDGLPFIGRYKKLPNSYFALGFGGNGITFSLIAAEIITALLTGAKYSRRNIFSFDRI
jgi:glycine/D-amino acid oxidase-like deaminating enzyme